MPHDSASGPLNSGHPPRRLLGVVKSGSYCGPTYDQAKCTNYRFAENAQRDVTGLPADRVELWLEES
jgi:hypothetical protein